MDSTDQKDSRKIILSVEIDDNVPLQRLFEFFSRLDGADHAILFSISTGNGN